MVCKLPDKQKMAFLRTGLVSGAIATALMLSEDKVVPMAKDDGGALLSSWETPSPPG